MLAEPEMAQRQPEWDRQLESIDNQELEIHQSQLRLMRDQTAVFIGDLEALRKEVLALKPVRGDVQALDTSLKELRDSVALEGAKREASRTRFEQRLCSELEQVLGIQLHTSLEADRDPLSPERVAQQFAVEPSHGSILARLARIEGDARGLGSEKLGRFHRDLQEVREVVGGEKLARERQKTTFDETVQAVESSYASLSERFGALERSLAESADARIKEFTGMCARLATQSTSGVERLEQLEAALRDTSSKHATELEFLRAGQVRQEAEMVRQAGESEVASASHARRLEELERVLQADMAAVRARLVKACVPERMDYLESMLGRTSDKHERMLEKTREDVERLSMHLEASERTGKVPEKVVMEQIQGSWGSVVRKQGEDLEVLRAAQAALAQELQAAKSSIGGDLADAKAAMEARTTGVKEQVKRLEKTLATSVERHSTDAMKLRDADARRAADFATLSSAILERFAGIEKGIANSGMDSEELAAVRSEIQRHGVSLGELSQAHDALARAHEALAGDSSALQALCASLRARLESSEAVGGEMAGCHEGELRAVSDELAVLREELSRDRGALEELHGRLRACERDGESIHALQVADSGLADALAARDAELGCLTGRLDCVQRLVGSAAETSAKALETAHAGMEKLRTRIMFIEGKRHMVDTLQSELADEKAASETRLASLEGRMDSMSRRIGEASGERAKELEAALNVRLASLEGRLDSLSRRFTESGGERGRELKEALDSRLAPLELRMEDFGRIAGQGDQSGQELEARVEFIEDMLVKSQEAHGGDVEALRATLAAHAGDLEAIKQAHVYHASLADRLEGLDRALGETSDRHDEHLADACAKLEHLGNRLSACEEQTTAAGDTRLLATSLSMDSTALETCCESLRERVDVIDGSLADSAKKCSAEFAAVKAAQERLAREFEARVEAFEGAQSASRDFDAKDLQAVKAKVENLGQRLTGFDRQVIALGDRQAATEAQTSSKLDLEHAYERLKEKVDSMDSTVVDSAHRLESARAAQERQARELEALKAASRQQAAVSEQLESLEARVEASDGIQSSSRDAHAKDLQVVKAKVDRLGDRLAGVDRQVLALEDRQTANEAPSSSKLDLECVCERLQQKVDSMDRTVADSAHRLESARAAQERQARELEALKAASRQQAAVTERFGSLEARVETFEARVETFEGVQSASRDGHTKDLQAVKAKVDQIGDRLVGVDRRVLALGDRQTANEAPAGSQLDLECMYERLKEKVDSMDSTMADSAHRLEGARAAQERQARELEALKAASRQQASVAERLDSLEARVEESEGVRSASKDVHAKDLQAVKAKVDRIGDRLVGFDRQVAALGDRQTASGVPASSNLDLEYAHERLKEKVDSMDSTVADCAQRLEGARAAQERQARELEALKAASRQQSAASEQRLDGLEASLQDADARHADGLATAQSQLEQLRGRTAAAERHGATLAELQRAQSTFARDREDWEARHEERLGEAEEKLGQATEKHERALEAAHARIEKLGGRISTCERQGGELRCAQSLHNDLKALIESQLATLKKRVDCLGETLGDGFNKRVWELEVVKEVASSSEPPERPPTVEDRLRELETGLGEVNGRQGRQLEALRSQLREVQQRSVQEHEAQEAWQQSFHESASAEKTARDAHHVAVDNRLKFFEDALSKSAEKHNRDMEKAASANSKNAKELEAACFRVDRLERDLAKERSVRGEAGTSLQQRLAGLERDLGASTARHTEELRSQHSDLVQHIGLLEQKLGDFSSFRKESLQLDDSLVQQLQEERKARESHLAAERRAREAQEQLVQVAHSKLDRLQQELDEDRTSGIALRERVDDLEQHLGELTVQQAEEPQALRHEFSLRIDQNEHKMAELIDLCDQFSVERAKWAELDSSIVQQLQEEKKARETQGGEFQAELSLERHAREAHERLVQEQFNQDRATRERFQDRLEDILAREGEVRERRLEGYEAALQHEVQSREAVARDLRELLATERAAHDQQHAKHFGILKDLDARMEGDSKILSEGVKALQRSLTICDSMLREEIDVRCKETKHLWEAISGCGQAQAPQAKHSDKEATEDDAEVTDSYVPFPCQPLTSFLRLGGQGLAESERRRRIRLFSPGSGSVTPRSTTPRGRRRST